MACIAVLVSNPCTGDARVIKMARAAAAAGHEVHVFATTGPHARPFEQKDGVNYHRLEWRLATHLMASGPLAWIRRISRGASSWLVRRVSPYVKYRLYKDVFSDAVATIKPDIVHAHDLICLPAGYAAARIAGARLVYDAHELEVHRYPPLPWLQKRMVGHVEKKYARKADAVITVGKLVAQELGRHIGRDDISVLYNSPVIAPCPNNIRKDLRIDDDTSLVLYVGKVTEGRGVRMMLDLLPQMPGVVLAAVGPSDARAKAALEAHAIRKGLATRFHILPPVPPEQVVNYIGGADVGVISSEIVALSYRYAMPNKLFEMSFADIAILSNTLDEIEMFLSEIGNGEIVDFDKKEQVPYVIYRMLNQRKRYRLTPLARKKLEEDYSWSAQVEKLLRIYDQILGKGGSELTAQIQIES
jgi:glycosyltransferase involved in cell wall biosynthesis